MKLQERRTDCLRVWQYIKALRPKIKYCLFPLPDTYPQNHSYTKQFYCLAKTFFLNMEAEYVNENHIFIFVS
jgi:hypothetical protein